eukprot:449646-Rhodomonas_salina.1
MTRHYDGRWCGVPQPLTLFLARPSSLPLSLSLSLSPLPSSLSLSPSLSLSLSPSLPSSPSLRSSPSLFLAGDAGEAQGQGGVEEGQ